MKQRGFDLIELAIAIGAAAAFLGVLFGGIHMWNNHMDTVRSEADKAGYTRGIKEASERDNTKLVAANAKLKELTDRVLALQAELDARLVEIDNAYSEGIKDGNTKKESVIADLRAGRLILRDPGAEARGGCAGPNTGSMPPPAGSVGSGDGAKGSALSGRLSDFLIGKFTDADNDLRQLAAAQDSITALVKALDECRVAN